MRLRYLLLVVAIFPAAPLDAEEPLKDSIAKLVSPVSVERREGEMWLAKSGPEVIVELIGQIERGDPKSQAEAIESLSLLVSPWQRGVEMGKRHHGQIELYRPMRPAGRPVNHPQAALSRKVLLAALEKSLQRIERKPPADADYDVYSQLSHLISTSSCALAEVADDRTSQAIRGLLQKEPDPTIGLQLMLCLEKVYCLPQFYQILGLCGVGLTPEILQEHQKREAVAYAMQKQALLNWLDKHASQPPAERFDSAISLWVQRFEENPSYYFSSGNGLPILALARLGDGGVPQLRKQQARESTLRGRGMLEIPIAAITGNVDDKLVRELIDTSHLSDHTQHQIACQIIAVAGSQGYQKELAAMLDDPRYAQLEVAHTLAIVHRHDAIPLLRKQPENNYVAHCAVKELESWAR